MLAITRITGSGVEAVAQRCNRALECVASPVSYKGRGLHTSELLDLLALFSFAYIPEVQGLSVISKPMGYSIPLDEGYVSTDIAIALPHADLKLSGVFPRGSPDAYCLTSDERGHRIVVIATSLVCAGFGW